jgi:hypothetical protein
MPAVDADTANGDDTPASNGPPALRGDALQRALRRATNRP